MKNGNALVGVSLPTLNTGWTVASIGDFNADGVSDIILVSASTGTLVDWLMTPLMTVGAAITLGSIGSGGGAHIDF